VTGAYTPTPLNEADRTVRSVPVSQSPEVFRNAMDALQSEPSVDVQQRAPGIQGDLSIRGSSFGQTLVLVNGLRLNDAQTGHNSLDLPFPFEAIERIEVLEGSGSTLYGADAFGGAVNFITATPPKSELRLGATGGSFGTNGQNGSLAYLAGPLGEEITFTRELSTGFIPDRDYRTLALGSQTAVRSPLGVTDLLLGLSDRPFGAAGFYGSYPSWERTKGWFAGLNQQLGSATDISFGYRRHTDLYDLYRYQPSIYQNDHVTESWQAALRRHDEISPSTHVYYGAEGYRDSISSNSLGRHTRDRGAVYASFDARTWKRFSFNAGAREELFTGGRRVFSPSVAGGYWLTSHLKLRANVSSAFRLPTFTDLYYSDPSNKGNAALQPEHTWNYEVGAELSFGRQTADLVVFQRRDTNDIDYVRTIGSQIWQAANIHDITFTGVEASLRMQVTSAQRLDFAFTGLRGEQAVLNGLESKYLFQYPVQSGTATWWGGLPGKVDVHARLGVLHRFGRDPYALLEFSASRSLGHFTPFLQLTNLANASYQEIPGVLLPGRSYLAGLEFWTNKGRR
jgi:iron complex outermembrane recepter protein